jgi:hypothetical protein
VLSVPKRTPRILLDSDEYLECKESTPRVFGLVTTSHGKNMPIVSRPPREEHPKGYSPTPRYQSQRNTDRDGSDQVHSVDEDEAEVSERMSLKLEPVLEIPLPQLMSKTRREVFRG